jgi:hypothetical protein
VIGGVQHGRRCCCQKCDPEGVLTAAVRAGYRERPAAPVVPTVAQVLRAVSPRRPAYVVDDATDRFRALLRDGLTAAEAVQQIEAEKKGNQP